MQFQGTLYQLDLERSRAKAEKLSFLHQHLFITRVAQIDVERFRDHNRWPPWLPRAYSKP